MVQCSRLAINASRRSIASYHSQAFQIEPERGHDRLPRWCWGLTRVYAFVFAFSSHKRSKKGETMPQRNGNGPAEIPAFHLPLRTPKRIARALQHCRPIFAKDEPGNLGFGDGIYERPDEGLLLLDGEKSGEPMLHACLPAQAFQWFARHDCFEDLIGDEEPRIRFNGQIARILALG